MLIFTLNHGALFDLQLRVFLNLKLKLRSSSHEMFKWLSWRQIPLQLIKPWYSAYSRSLHKVCLFTFFALFEDKRPSGAKRETWKCEKEKVRIRETRKCRICGIIKQNRKYKSMELSADRTEEETNLWFLWFHQHD